MDNVTLKQPSMKTTFTVGKVVQSTQYWCTRCGWADGALFSTNRRTGTLYKRCDPCRKLRGKESNDPAR